MEILIVNERDQIINTTIGGEIEEDLEGIYRVSVLWLLDKDSNVLLSQRSLSKAYHTGLWGPATVGIVEKEETYEDHVKKSAYANLGLMIDELIVAPKVYIETNRKYFAQFFVHVLPNGFETFMIRKEELNQAKWFSKADIDALLLATPEMFTPLFRETYDTMRVYEVS